MPNFLMISVYIPAGPLSMREAADKSLPHEKKQSRAPPWG